jgi:hypothetical protein
MGRNCYDPNRETIWGISPKDRQWFQLLTLIGGVAGSVILTRLEIVHGSDGATPNEMARNILLGIGASFVAAGFIAWGLLQAKELIMAIADWIREATERRRKRLREEGRREGYERGYEDAQKGKPKELLGDEPGKSS